MARASRTCIVVGLLLGIAVGCGERPSAPTAAAGGATDAGAAGERVAWAVALHGGAGTIPRHLPAAEVERYRASLTAALRLAAEVLDGGGSSLDAVERTVRLLEDDPLFNAGRGAVFNADGGHELDASIMDGRDRSCGAVAGVSTVRHPISLARLVMERTPHVLLVGSGAERFASEVGVELVEPGFFDTDHRRRQLEDKLARERETEHGTVGVVALDRRGHLAAGTSTGGLTGKRFGRVGDSPIPGAGTWADDTTCAVSGTGKGEEFIRHTVARSIAALMELEGLSVAEAADRVVHGTLAPGDGGVVAVDSAGRIALVFNSEGMYRGAADASGRFEIAIWDDVLRPSATP